MRVFGPSPLDFPRSVFEEPKYCSPLSHCKKILSTKKILHQNFVLTKAPPACSLVLTTVASGLPCRIYKGVPDSIVDLYKNHFFAVLLHLSPVVCYSVCMKIW